MPNKLNIDQILQHELQIARLANGEINSLVVPSLEATYAAIRALINDRGLPQTPFQLRQLEKAIREAIEENAGWATFTTNAEQFAAYEASVYQGIIDTITELPVSPIAEGKLQKYVTAALMTLESGSKTRAGTWAQFVQDNISSRAREINNVVRTGYSRGWTIGKIGREMRGRFEVLRRESEALARTGYSHYANAAREAMAEQYSIAMEWVWVSTLDSRTTIGCAALDGERWPQDQLDQIPPIPRHFNCRSTKILVPEGTELVGTRASVGRTAGGDRKPGQVRATTQYEDFLSRQPAAFQNEVLGEKRARLFRKGGLPLDRFVDMTGRPLTLDELKAQDPDIWRSVFG